VRPPARCFCLYEPGVNCCGGLSQQQNTFIGRCAFGDTAIWNLGR
jgi:hypothetical protein